MDLKEANAIALRAAQAFRQIKTEHPNPGGWGALIAKEAPEIRECLREYLKQHYRALSIRGKKSSAADAAIDAIKTTIQGRT